MDNYPSSPGAEDFGGQLQRYRKRRRLTQTELAVCFPMTASSSAFA